MVWPSRWLKYFQYFENVSAQAAVVIEMVQIRICVFDRMIASHPFNHLREFDMIVVFFFSSLILGEGSKYEIYIRQLTINSWARAKLNSQIYKIQSACCGNIRPSNRLCCLRRCIAVLLALSESLRLKRLRILTGCLRSTRRCGWSGSSRIRPRPRLPTFWLTPTGPLLSSTPCWSRFAQCDW